MRKAFDKFNDGLVGIICHQRIDGTLQKFPDDASLQMAAEYGCCRILKPPRFLFGRPLLSAIQTLPCFSGTLPPSLPALPDNPELLQRKKMDVRSRYIRHCICLPASCPDIPAIIFCHRTMGIVPESTDIHTSDAAAPVLFSEVR